MVCSFCSSGYVSNLNFMMLESAVAEAEEVSQDQVQPRMIE